jgi:hypothetical protein
MFNIFAARFQTSRTNIPLIRGKFSVLLIFQRSDAYQCSPRSFNSVDDLGDFVAFNNVNSANANKNNEKNAAGKLRRRINMPGQRRKMGKWKEEN